MSTVEIRGISVNFPFEPYEIQKEYMAKVLECLQNKTNGLLESPTGTGKTLALLCSSLAWLQEQKAQAQAQRLTNGFGGENEFLNSLMSKLEKTAGKVLNGRSFLGLPTIIYASRTHSQLSQAMKELKNTSYNHMKACILGSRNQMCINSDLMHETDKDQMCQLKVKTRTCYYYNRVEHKKEHPAVAELNIVDIEDIIKLGNCHKFCPYYMSKELVNGADIIFMPYNYLLDHRIRKSLNLRLSNNVVILDEAHNIERICEESASVEIKASDITLAIEDVTAVMKMVSENISGNFEEGGNQDFSAEDLCFLKQILLDFEKELDNIHISGENADFDGDYIFEFLGKAGVQDINSYKIIGLISSIIQYLSTVADSPFARRGTGLKFFENFLETVFVSSSEEFKEKVKRCYKVHIEVEETKKKKPSNWLSKATEKRSERILCYWCFSPGFGMNTLVGQDLRSLILTSGTLAPLSPLISELEINIQVRLENPHIVKSNQICVKIITAGPDSEILNCNYNNRDNPKYLHSVGISIMNLSRVIPKGLLIFFPSYPIMHKCQEYWQQSGIWSSINSQKAIYVEPKNKDSFNDALNEYYSNIQNPSLKGSIFMGVCRGKVSEGVDFADSNGRAVIIIGLPYPPLKSPKVVLKKKYLDLCNIRDKEYLKGNDWYSLEASRAVNQAIGRVIRHRRDYGAIILMDTRFNNFRIKNQMSLWLREHVKVVNTFGEVLRDLSMFFKNADIHLSTQVQPKPQVLKESVIPKSTTGVFDFSTSSIGDSSLSSSLGSGEVSVYKRTTGDIPNPAKRKKINLIPNSTNPKPSDTSIKEYIIMIRKSLDEASFKQFTEGLQLYKETQNFNELTLALDNIFKDKQHLRYLIQGLETYIMDRHKADFNNYWLKIK